MEKIEKALNVSFNAILLSVGGFQIAFSEAFGQVVNKLGETISKSLGTKPSADLSKTIKGQTSKEIVKMIQGMKSEIKSQKDFSEVMKKLITKKDCDQLISIAEKYKFGLPPLTEELGDEDILGYLYLASKQDKKYMKMIEELMIFNDKFQKNFEKEEGFNTKNAEQASTIMKCSNCGLDLTGQVHSGIKKGECRMSKNLYSPEDTKCPNCGLMFGESVHTPLQRGKCAIEVRPQSYGKQIEKMIDSEIKSRVYKCRNCGQIEEAGKPHTHIKKGKCEITRIEDF